MNLRVSPPIPGFPRKRVTLNPSSECPGKKSMVSGTAKSLASARLQAVIRLGVLLPLR